MSAPQRSSLYSWFYWWQVVFTSTLLIGFGFLVFDFITHPLAPEAELGSTTYRLLLVLANVPLAFTVAILILRRAPGNVVGLFLVQHAILIMSLSLRQDSPLSGYNPGRSGWVGLWLLPLYFPDGRAFPRRFEPHIRLLSAALVLVVSVWTFFQPTYTYSNFAQNRAYELPNPLFVPSLAPFQSLMNTVESGLLLITIVIILPSVIARFRASDYVVRQQMKWVGWVIAAIIVTALPLAVAGINTRPAITLSDGELFLMSIWSLLISVAPFLAVGNAILRYRLYDIDIIIRRTLVYSVISAILAGVYFGGVALMQSAFVALTGQESPLAVVASTLAIAALFTPVRRRVQDVVDRRFFRRKYDAEKTVDAFARTARDEVDMDRLREALLDAVDATMQPQYVSLWIAPVGATRSEV